MQAFWTVLLGISAFANRIAEAAKGFVDSYWTPPTDPALLKKHEAVVSLIALMVSLVAGVFGAILFNLNLFTLFPDNPYLSGVSPIAGVLFTGCLASGGSELLQFLGDLLGAGADRLQSSGTTMSASMSMTTETPPEPPAQS